MTNHRKVGISSLAAAAALCAITAWVGDAEARDGRANAQRSRPAASGSWTRTTQTQRTANGHSRSDTWTGANGRTASRDVVVTNDKDAGTRTREATRTGPDGKTTTTNTVLQRTDGGYSSETTRTLPDGTVQTHSVDVACDKDAKACTRTVEHNGGA